MTRTASQPPRILHLHSTFSPGGKELRCVQLVNALGPGLHHAIVSAEPNQMGAAQHFSSRARVSYPADFPSLKGRPSPGRLNRLAQAMQQYDLVLTYNWGAMDAVMAHTLFRDALGLPPLIHHEDGFNEDEQRKLKWRRNLYRKLALGKANALVVPSETLEQIALETWEQPLGRVKLIPNGIDTGAFAKKPKKDALRRIIKRPEEKWVGTLAGLRPVKNLPMLVRAFAGLPEPWQLVIVGDGPQADAIRAEADRLSISGRVHLPGFAPDPARFIGLFDIFALSSHSEQFPISVVEAMAAGRPVAAPAVGDIAEMVAQENTPLITRPGDEAELREALVELARDAAKRDAIGAANQAKAREHFDQRKMISAYRGLYSRALGIELPA